MQPASSLPALTPETQIGYSYVFTPTASLAFTLDVITPINLTIFVVVYVAIGVYLVVFGGVFTLFSSSATKEIDV